MQARRAILRNSAQFSDDPHHHHRYTDSSKRLRRLLVLLREFEVIERRYVDSMARVCVIRASVSEVLDRAALRAIFANSHQILELHRWLLPGIVHALRHLPPGADADEARTAARAERSLVELAHLFSRAAPMFMLHSEYLTSFFKQKPFVALNDLLVLELRRAHS